MILMCEMNSIHPNAVIFEYLTLVTIHSSIQKTYYDIFSKENKDVF